MSYLLKSLVASGKIPLYLDFRTGSLKDLGGMGNNAASAGAERWSPRKGQLGMHLPSNANVTVAHHASLIPSQITIVSHMDRKAASDPGNSHICVMDPGIYSYEFYFNATTSTPYLWVGATGIGSPITNEDWISSIAVSWPGAGTAPRFYKNASVLGTAVGPLPVSPVGAGVLRIGSYMGANLYYLNGTMFNLVIVNEALDDADTTRLMRELSEGPTVVRRPSKHFSLPYPAKTPAEYAAEGCVMDADCEQAGAASLAELVGGKVFTAAATTAKPNRSEKGGPFVGGLRFGKTALAQGLRCANLGNLELTSITLDMWCKPGLSASPMSWSIDDAHAYFGTSQFAFVQDNSAAKYGTHVAAIPVKWCHAVATFTAGDTLPRLYIDGVKVTLTASDPGALDVNANAVCVIGAYYLAPSSYTFDGDIARVKLLDHPVTPAEVRAEYLKGARKCLLDASLHRDGSCPVSLATVPAKNKVGPWTVVKEPARLEEDAPVGGAPGKRIIMGRGAASRHTMSMPDKEAYGSWYGEFDTVSGSMWMVTASVSDDSDVASQNGYAVMSISNMWAVYRITAGVAIGPFILLVGGPFTGRKKFWLTRRFDGLFSLWAKDATTYLNWTFIGSAVDTTHTTSSFQVRQENYKDSMTGDAKHFLGEMTPYEAIELGLIEGEVPDPITFTTADTTQSWTATVNTGKNYVFDWGDGTTTWKTGTGVSQAITHTYAGAGTYTIKLYVEDPTSITALNGGNNGLMGSVPDVSTWTALRSFYLDYNLLTGTLPSFASNLQLRFFAVTANDIGGTLPDFSACVNLITFYIAGNLFTGSLPSFAACTALQYFNCGNNLLTGALPAFAGSAMLEFDCYSNNFSGPIPSFAAHTGMTRLLAYDNQFSGDIPDFAPCTALANFRVYDNQLTGRVAGTVATTCTMWRADTNGLSVTAVDGVLADFVTNLAGRPANCTINLSAGTNSAPSAAGLASKATILAARPLWVITHA